MSAPAQNDEAEATEDYEMCPEIDEDFFSKMEESGNFVTVDSWEPNNDVKVEIKESPSRRSSSKDAKPSRSRTESERSRDREKERKNHDRDKERRRRSPELPRRPRSPPARQRSPPARRYPPSRPETRRQPPPSKRPSFLDEMKARFPDIQREQQHQNMAINQQNAFGMPMNAMVNYNFMPGPGNMPGPPFMQPHPFNQNGPMPLTNHFPPQQPPVIFQPNILPVNPMNNSMIPPGTYVPDFPINPPRPVKPPEPPIFAPASTSRISLLDDVSPRKNEEPTTKKSLPLIDMLRKISEAKNRESTEAAKNERVREARNLLDELDTDDRHLPFTFNLTDKPVSPVRSSPQMKLRSPLVMSDHNPIFMSQATDVDCRDAMLGNPLRNITGELFDFARHLGLDLVEISEKVKAAAEPTAIAVEKSKPQLPQTIPQLLKPQVKREFPADISSIQIDLTCSHKSVQTMFKACDDCEARAKRNFTSKAIQCDLAVPFPVPMKEEPGSFKANFDVATMNTISETQRQALAKFCQAFDLYPDSFGAVTEPLTVGRLVKTEKRAPPAVLEDLAAFTNPENPHQDGFLSFSPVRESPKLSPFSAAIYQANRHSRSQSGSRFDTAPYGSRNRSRSISRSPVRQQYEDSPLGTRRRSRSFDASPPNTRNGRFDEDDYDLGSFDRSRMSRSRSPQGLQNRSPRGGYQGRYPRDDSPPRRPIAERLGNKVPSPTDGYMDPRSSSHYTETRPYFIPSPRNRRPSPSFRENSFDRGGRDKQRSRSRSPVARRRSPGYRQPPMSRRGRF